MAWIVLFIVAHGFAKGWIWRIGEMPFEIPNTRHRKWENERLYDEERTIEF